MSEKQKKPLFKKWWVWLVAFIIVGGIIGATSDDETTNTDEVEGVETGENEPEEVEEEMESQETATVEDSESEEEEPEVSTLTDEDVSYLEEHLTQSLEDEQDFGDMFYLEEFDYDADANRVTARIDMQQDPLPETREDVADWAEMWAWSLVMPTELEKDFNVRVTLVTKFEEDEYVLWGHSLYNSDNGKYTFEEESGMQLYD